MIIALLFTLLVETAATSDRVQPETDRDSLRGSAAPPESLYVALLDTGPAYVPGGSLQRQPGGAGHSAHMKALTLSGVLVLGGPYGDNPEGRIFSGAILLLRAPSLADARRIVGADPGIASGLLQIATVSRWVPAAGTLARGLRQALAEGR
jgi:uncharacterized protein YciI